MRELAYVCVIQNPKANGYLKTYTGALVDGTIYAEAKAMRRSNEDALRSQIPYILSNLRATTPELKEFKLTLLNLLAKLRD